MTATAVTGEAVFGADLASAGQARSFLRAELATLDLDDDVVDTIVLLASELVTNAVLHARTDLIVRYMLHPGCVRIEVLDGNSRLPSPVAAPLDATSGRGLALVQSLADNWGIERTAGGKTVWIEIPTLAIAA